MITFQGGILDFFPRWGGFIVLDFRWGFPPRPPIIENPEANNLQIVINNENRPRLGY